MAARYTRRREVCTQVAEPTGSLLLVGWERAIRLFGSEQGEGSFLNLSLFGLGLHAGDFRNESLGLARDRNLPVSKSALVSFFPYNALVESISCSIHEPSRSIPFNFLRSSPYTGASPSPKLPLRSYVDSTTLVCAAPRKAAIPCLACSKERVYEARQEKGHSAGEQVGRRGKPTRNAGARGPATAL